MSHPPLYLSNQSGGLEPNAFQTQLRRLESLQTLMTQGGAVVSEVAQFLARAREELNALQREQQSYAEAQQLLAQEKTQLASQCAEALSAVEEATTRANLGESRVAQLEAQLAQSGSRVSREEWETERQKSAELLSSANGKIKTLEEALLKERVLREQGASKVRQQEASVYATEIALLKNRLSALEHQLEAERERRVRLMEVVKVHEVSVNPQKLREPV